MPWAVLRLGIVMMDARVVLAVAVLLAGCPSSPMGVAASDGDTQGSGDASQGTGGDGESDGDTHQDSSFIEDVDAGAGAQDCRLGESDCPDGSKCNPVWPPTDGETACVPLPESPAGLYEPCVTASEGEGGADDCGEGLACVHVDPNTGQGICASYCVYVVGLEICGDPNAVCPMVADGAVLVCPPQCDPRVQDCPVGGLQLGCYPVNDTFGCDQVAPDARSAGSVCDNAYQCEAGSTCVASDHLPACEGRSCCAPYCDLESMSPDTPCSGDARCVSWLEVVGGDDRWMGVGFCGSA